MTSPLDSYTRSMGNLHFSDEVKARMTEGLRAAAVARVPRRTLSPKSLRKS